MKKERIETLVDSFTNEMGTHHFVLAAISEVLPTVLTCEGEDIEVSYDVCVESGYDCDYIQSVVKGVKLGVSICNPGDPNNKEEKPGDTFNEELGKIIAIGRARKNAEYALFSSKPGYINTDLVQAFLRQEAKYLKDNPEVYIKSYKRKK